MVERVWSARTNTRAGAAERQAQTELCGKTGADRVRPDRKRETYGSLNATSSPVYDAPLMATTMYCLLL